MDYDLLLDGCCEMGVQLLRCGAEIHRAEDTIRRLLSAYGLEGEVFAIPNCLIVSIIGSNGHTLTRMRRVPLSSVNVDGIERFNALSRQLCSDPPAHPGEILDRCHQQAQAVLRQSCPLWQCLLGYFVGGFFFTLFFSGGLAEGLVGGMAGLLSGLSVTLLSRVRSNFFITILVSGFVLGVSAYLPLGLGVPVNLHLSIAGGIMVLVPGLVFTNFMSNLLSGDVVSGLSTFARAILSAGAIALGTGAAMVLCRTLWTVSENGGQTLSYSATLCCMFAFVACLGFCPSYNVQGMGALLCALGGAMGWTVSLVVQHFSGNPFLSSLLAAVAVGVYAECMARIRKCPASSYLVISMFPLVPGLSVYRAMDYSLQGDTQQFLDTFLRTFGIAGCLSLGLLIVSTALAIVYHYQRRAR